MASEDIVKLEFPLSVRQRFGMYIGTADNCSVILREAAENSIDEIYAGKSGPTPCDTVWIESKNGEYLVADNCRGIPIKESPQQKGWTMARLAVGSLHAGSKFDSGRATLGTNGVGVSCTCALSEEFQILSRLNLHDVSTLPKYLQKEVPEKITDSTYYFCRFEKGILKEEGFKEFFEKEVPGNPLKAEYLIPIFIGELLEQEKMSVKVLKTNDTWYGMTYHEDVAAVKDSFKKMLEDGVYKADLFSDL